MLLFHHDPARTDEQVMALRDKVAASTDIPVDAAVQGMVVEP